MKIKLLRERMQHFSPCSLLVLPLLARPVNKVHQTLLLNGRIFYLSKSRYELQISFTLLR